jgi:hypothetical protein
MRYALNLKFFEKSPYNEASRLKQGQTHNRPGRVHIGATWVATSHVGQYRDGCILLELSVNPEFRADRKTKQQAQMPFIVFSCDRYSLKI